MVLINNKEYQYVGINDFLEDANKVYQPKIKDVLKFTRGKKREVEHITSCVDLSYPQLWQIVRMLIKLDLLKEEKLQGRKGNAKVVFTKDSLIKTFTRNREEAIKQQNKILTEDLKASPIAREQWDYDPTK